MKKRNGEAGKDEVLKMESGGGGGEKKEEDMRIRYIARNKEGWNREKSKARLDKDRKDREQKKIKSVREVNIVADKKKSREQTKKG